MGSSAVEISEKRPTGSFAGLFGYTLVFRTVSKDGDVEHWATNDLTMGVQQRESLVRQAWGIEVSHRRIEQRGGVENPKRAKRKPSEITSAWSSKHSCGSKRAV